jgi:hypothetical protein
MAVVGKLMLKVGFSDSGFGWLAKQSLVLQPGLQGCQDGQVCGPGGRIEGVFIAQGGQFIQTRGSLAGRDFVMQVQGVVNPRAEFLQLVWFERLEDHAGEYGLVDEDGVQLAGLVPG